MSEVEYALMEQKELKERKESEKRASVQNTVKSAIEEAVRHYQENQEPDQAKATDYYYGREFGGESDKRSRVVATVVRDITLSQIPSIMRVIWGPERVVEFRGNRPEKDEEADQATDVVRYIISEDNPGFLSTMAVLKDGLVRRLGWWKWWWDTTERTERMEFSGLTEDQLYVLANDESVDDIEVTGQYEMQAPMQDPSQPAPPPVPLFEVAVTRRFKEGRVFVREVPPDEIGYTPNAKDLDDAACVVHSRYVPTDYLLARGIDPELVEEAQDKQKSAINTGSSLQDARLISGTSAGPRWDGSLDESQIPVLFTEAYVLMQVDDEYGGKRAERRRFDCVGPNYEIANGDGLGVCVDEVPIAHFTPEPEPHTLEGQSNYDLVGTIQLIISQVERAMLDSLAEAVNPVTIVVADDVNLGDLLKPDSSRIVRVHKDVNSVREQKTTFVGPDTMPVLSYYKEIMEQRTGSNAGGSNLDADALQSTEKAAAASVLSSKQARIEMICRVYAETTMKRMYRGVLKLFCRHQQNTRWMKLRGKWTPVDPRSWDATMDLSINVGLGQGTPQDKLAVLAGVVTTTQNLQATGIPFVSNVELRRAIARGYQAAGLNPDEFLKPWGPQEEQQYQQAMSQQPQQPSPEQQLVVIEGQKAQASAAIDAEKMDLERLRIELEDDRERERMAQDKALKILELQLKYRADQNSHAAELLGTVVDHQIGHRKADLEETKIEATASAQQETA